MKKKIMYEFTFAELQQKFGIQSKLVSVLVNSETRTAEFVFDALPEGSPQPVIDTADNTPGYSATTFKKDGRPASPPAQKWVDEASPLDDDNVKIGPSSGLEGAESFKITGKTPPIIDKELMDKAEDIRKKTSQPR